MAEVGESITSPVKEKDRTETLGNFPKDARLEHVVLQGIPRETRDELSHALSIFPVDKRAIPDNVPPFQAVVLTPDKKQRESEDTEPADISYIFTPGITARAKHMTPIASEVYKATEKLGKSLGFSAALSSSGSVDVLDAQFEKDPLLRAIPQALMTVDLIQKYATKEIIFLGHSLGSLETPYIAVLVEQLLKDRGIPTKVAGMVLENPGGQYTMNLRETIGGFASSLMVNGGAIREAFPSWNEVFTAQAALDKAVEKEDAGEILRRRIRLKEMRDKLENLPDISHDKKESVKTLDDGMYDAWMRRDTKTFKKLMKERDALLQEEYRNHMSLGAKDLTPKGNQPSASKFLLVGRSIIHGEGRVNTTHPEWLRNLVNIPVGFLRSEGDVLFKPEVTNYRMTSDEIDRRIALRSAGLTGDAVTDQARFFPNAPAVFNGRVLGATHILSGNHPERYGTIVADLIHHMDEVSKEGNEVINSLPQKQVNLTY